MKITKRGAQDGGLQSSRNQNESGPDSYEKFFWLIDDHPSHRDEHDLELSRAQWGDYFQTSQERIAEWRETHGDPGPDADFSISIAAPATAGADMFF